MKRSILFLTLIVFGLAMLAYAPTVRAASIVVNDAGDTSNACAADGVTSPCTLRDAITFANANAGADTITFNIPLGGACPLFANDCTITLGSKLPTITTDMTIDGAPNSGHIKVSGGSAVAIMQVTGGTVNLNALTFADGSGGALSPGAIEIVGVGIVVNVTNSTFTGNKVSSNGGGAIGNFGGTLNVTNSTFFNNHSTSSGNGGAVFSNGTLNVTNSTFDGNYSTSGTGGTIHNQAGTATLKNTIIANSTSGGNCSNTGTLTADSYNIVDDNTCGSATQKTTAEIALSALADNGGPTFTMAIDGTSAAFNAGDNTVCAAAPVNSLDQTGIARPRGLICDVGAYEYVYLGFQTGPNFVVNSSADTDDRSCDLLGQGIGNQDCTLREAIAFANANANASTITFNIPLMAGCTSANTCIITLGSNLPHIQEQATIDGAPNNGHITVDGVNTHQIFWAEAETTLNALTVANGNALLSSGGFYNVGVISVVSNSTFVHNSGASGSHVKNDGGGWLEIVNSTFSNPAVGIAIGNTGSSTLDIYNSTIDGNNVTGSSGVDNISGATTLYNTIVSNNDASDCLVVAGTLTADSFNLDNDGTCDNATQATIAAIALLGLTDNGGHTQTFALNTGSVAINAGHNTICAAAPVNNIDQRTATRPQGLFCDVGAYEFQYSGFQTGPDFVVNHSADTDDGSCDLLGQGIGNQDCTLREAINAVNALNGAHTITFNIPGTDGGCTVANTCTITLGNNLPHVQETVTIDGAPNNGHITVDGVNTYQIFWAEANTTLNALTVTRGSGLLSSGGFYVGSGITATVSNSTFDHNLAASGGHIKNDGGTLTIVNSTFSDAPNNGIGNLGGGTLNIYNSTINGNNQPGSGGISNVSGTTTLYNTIVVNHASADCSNSGTLTADSYNLDEDGTCDNATQKTSAEINLQPLGNNGGPTFTMALLSPSAALNTGNNAVCGAAPVDSLDQRGVTRPQGTQCDVGAYEATGPTAVNVTGLRGKVNAKGNVVVQWKTTNESQIAGFNVYRQTKSGEWKQINAKFKQAKHPGDASSDKYRFTDRKVNSGKTYRYKIEVLYLDNHSEWTNVVTVKTP